MNRISGRLALITSLAVAGLLFSGYLSGVKFLSSECALSEQCPYVWGYPACYYGFAMYLIMVIFLAQFYFRWVTKSVLLSVLKVVSGAGILFAGYFTIQELPALMERGLAAYVLGLPSCAYGLMVYTAIFVIASLVREE